MTSPFPEVPEVVSIGVRQLLDALDQPPVPSDVKDAIRTLRMYINDREGNVGIEALDLSVRAYNVLKRQRIDTVRQVASQSFWDLLDIRNFGSGAMDETSMKLQAWTREHGPIKHVEKWETDQISKEDFCMGCRVNSLLSTTGEPVGPLEFARGAVWTKGPRQWN